uniref:hypothetical protein n=1 Tax=Micromonospora acroterricola TaxID=2202421 RepID=UPI00191C6290|nr:hypothetical protein [Micromonospora acroterricola]
MARRGWGVSIATAVGVAAGAGAAQLGFGYGLGVITWTPTDAAATDTAWADGLAWAAWLAASSTVLGAVCAQRLHQRAAPSSAEPRPTVPDATPPAVPDPADGPQQVPVPGAESRTAVEGSGPASATDGPSARITPPVEREGLLRRVSLALGAAIGGLVTVLLVAVPARVAAGADTAAPQRVAAVHAALGILIGVLVALWALRSRAAAVNVTATAAWLWLLAVVSVVDGVRVGRGLTGAQLGTWQLDPDHARYWIGDQLYWPGALLALVPALLIGALAARRAARSTGHLVGAAASGAAGPLLVALAYLTTVPRWSALGPAQLSTQLIAPYAVIAGIGGSVLAAVLAERVARNRTANPGEAVPGVAATLPPRAGVTSAVDPGAAPAAGSGATSDVEPRAEALTADSPGGTAARRGTADAAPSTSRARSRTRDTDAAPPTRDAAAVPRVPAPRTDPDLSGPAEPAGGEPAAGSRRRRPPRPATD